MKENYLNAWSTESTRHAVLLHFLTQSIAISDRPDRLHPSTTITLNHNEPVTNHTLQYKMSRIDWKNYDYSEGPPKAKPNRDTNPYNSKSSAFKSRSPVNLPVPDDSDNAIDHFHMKTNPIEPSMQPKLSYRPPSKSKLPFDEMEEPTISNRTRFPLVDEPFDTVTQSSTPSPQPITPPQMMRLNVPAGGEETIRLSTRDDFDDVWDQAENEWDQDEANPSVVVSDDDDCQQGPYQFESFAGDRSVRSAATEKLSVKSGSFCSVGHMDVPTLSSKRNTYSSLSEMDNLSSLNQMDIPENGPPVSILRSTGRFIHEQSPGGSVGSGASSASSRNQPQRSPSRSQGSFASRRKHPWDQEENGPMDEVEEHMDEVAIPDVEDDHSEKTDLTQYEADDQEVAEDELQPNHNVASFESLSAARVEEQPCKQPYNLATKDDNSQIERKERRRRPHSRYDGVAEDDDTSIEDFEAPKNRGDTLQDRTKQAWSKRNQATGIETDADAPLPAIIPRMKDPMPRKKDGVKKSLVSVSFQPDTVHEFVPEERQERTSDDEGTESDGATEVTDYTEDYSYYDDDTLAGRSMHSVYTKSNESEAEDFFKDLFLIGSGKATNPGKRQFKHKKEYKQRFKDAQKVSRYMHCLTSPSALRV